MKNSVKKLNRCICCNSSHLNETLNLGELPLANEYKSKPNQKWDKYPLVLNTCMECFHSQLSVVVDPDILFKDYCYVSGTSDTLKRFFDSFAKRFTDKFPNKKTVLDIACNDGSQLDTFKKYGWKTYGVDPAENIVSKISKHEVVNDYWQHATFNKKFDLIVAQNVFAHTSDLDGFLKNCLIHMKEDSVILIQTSQCKMFQNGQFDTIYHEHISYFNTNSMKELLKRYGLYINNISVEDIHGKSYLFEISKKESYVEPLGFEQCLFDKDFYKQYKIKCETIRSKFIKDNVEYGIGSAAKGMTFLGYCNSSLKYIFDENPNKVGLYCPYSIYPIKDLSESKKYFGNCVILAWNFSKELIAKSNSKGLKHKVYFDV